ncbi:hypothetical protein ACFQJ7_11315 [Halovenus rubra]|uniref:Uncharacterized protein n=2 Tax=Halovenus rubra TaxID=869890 RepID=A0ACC7E4N2_9EURY|nr:hypothetical protein [Halovenus rubra]
MTNTDNVFETLTQWWMTLETGWQAVLLGFLALLVVSLGVPIPW